MKKRVAILGGGVAGMSAAHELVERGFDVVVYEQRTIPGGKARSMPVPGSGIAGRRELPGEHGFRFFPGFYKHLFDTMKRIPYGKNPNGVFDNLVKTQSNLWTSVVGLDATTPTRAPTSVEDLSKLFEFIFGSFYTKCLRIPIEDVHYYFQRLLVLLTSCKERCFAEYEYIDWYTFIGSASRSPEYQNYLGNGLSQLFVAVRGKEVSARTGGLIWLQLLLELIKPDGCSDRVLNGPTNDVWIQPWLNYLQQCGVDYHLGAQIKEIHCSDQSITGVTIMENGSMYKAVADYYIAALPVDIMQRLVTESMKKIEPRLAAIHHLRTESMNGIQFYLDQDVSFVHGHMIYLDSPWALTSISQKQFWPNFKLAQYGDGTVKDILSVDISDWNTPGILYGKPAKECTPEEIKNEVWSQIQAHLKNNNADKLNNSKLVRWFLDPAITYPEPNRVVNLEPLLINTVGSWDYRPSAVTRIKNFFLASDYVRTYTDLATMEGANEAARRAVNGIIGISESSASMCEIWQQEEPAILAPLRLYDRVRFEMGLPHQSIQS